MVGGIQAALSGLQAYSTRVEKNANNVANLNTEGFKKDRVTLSEQSPEGVKANVTKVETPGALVPVQTSEGQSMVELSNADLGEEMPELMLNQQTYTANLKTIQTSDEMTQSLLDLKA